MSSKLKHLISWFICILLLMSMVWLFLMIIRGPKVAFMADYNIRFKDCPSTISRKMHLDLGIPKELLESGETVYNVETDVFGVKSTVSFYFLGGSQLYKVFIKMPMNDSAQIETTFQEIIALIETAYKNNSNYCKSNAKYKNEYDISINIPVSGATSISYSIDVTNGVLTISSSYYW